MALLLAIWDVLVALAPWLLLGAAIAGVLHVALPANFIRRHLSGRRGVAKAVALGVPLPLCSCGVIPAGLGIKKDGASDGATVGFLISTPQTGVDSLLVSASFLGWPFAVFKLVSAAVTGLVGGWLTDAASPAPDPVAATEASSEPPRRRSLSAAVEHGLEVLRSIWGWLVFGVVASAVITVYVPDSAFASLGGEHELLAFGVALLISIPLYVCATASVPIAAALVGAGLPAGAALVFLMAGPATNLATLGTVYRTLGRRSLAIYLGTIVIGSVGLGYAFDFVLPDAAVAMGMHDHAAASPLETLAAAGLLGLLAWFAIGDLTSRLRSASEVAPGTPGLDLRVDGLTCQGCVAKLTRALEQAPGVTSARVSLDPGLAQVTGDAPAAQLREVVRAAGFTPV